ncbi:MAG: hypothetical protein IPM35_36010 [Myxococcales bacterium]|nr:hypothetical protein [Myxococcales bacterium]
MGVDEPSDAGTNLRFSALVNESRARRIHLWLGALLSISSCRPASDARPTPAPEPWLELASAAGPTGEGVPDAAGEIAPAPPQEAGTVDAGSEAAPPAPRAPVPTPTRDALVQAVLDALAARDVEALLALTPTPAEIESACGAADKLRPDGREMLSYAIRRCGGYVPPGSQAKAVAGGEVTGRYADCPAVALSKFLTVTIDHPNGSRGEAEVRIDEPAKLGQRWVILDNPRCQLK